LPGSLRGVWNIEAFDDNRPMHAHVKNGRLTLDELTDLPEGTDGAAVR
jgi:hypothetical protein